MDEKNINLINAILNLLVALLELKNSQIGEVILKLFEWLINLF